MKKACSHIHWDLRCSTSPTSTCIDSTFHQRALFITTLLKRCYGLHLYTSLKDDMRHSYPVLSGWKFCTAVCVRLVRTFCPWAKQKWNVCECWIGYESGTNSRLSQNLQPVWSIHSNAYWLCLASLLSSRFTTLCAQWNCKLGVIVIPMQGKQTFHRFHRNLVSDFQYWYLTRGICNSTLPTSWIVWDNAQWSQTLQRRGSLLGNNVLLDFTKSSAQNKKHDTVVAEKFQWRVHTSRTSFTSIYTGLMITTFRIIIR